MSWFKNPSDDCPAFNLTSFNCAKIPATTGDAAEVPATAVNDPPLYEMKYGFTSPASADTSGYPRPLLL